MSTTLLALKDGATVGVTTGGDGSASVQGRSGDVEWQPPQNLALSLEPQTLTTAETREREGYEEVIRHG